MGRFPLPTEKQRQQIVQHRKNYEMNLSTSLRMQGTTKRGTSAPPKVCKFLLSWLFLDIICAMLNVKFLPQNWFYMCVCTWKCMCMLVFLLLSVFVVWFLMLKACLEAGVIISAEASSAETSDIPQIIEAEVIRSSPGVLVVQYKQEDTNTKYTGILLAENGANGTPGIISEDMSRFRETVKAYVDAPIIDQWTSVIGERFATSGLQLRARSYMRKNGRMVCASCMEAIPDNEMITRKHFVNANQRKLQSIPKETKRIVAQLPSSGKPIVVDEVGYELLDEHLSGETADYSSDASVSSAPLRRRNKRKAYVPRGACSVLVPAGVDLFEPEYDPLPGPSSGSARGLCNVEPSHKHAKSRLLSTSVTTKNRRAGSDLLRNNSSSGRICTLLNSNPEPTKNEDVQNISSGSTRRFKSDKIRRAFSSEYSIRKPVSDSLHMTFVRQSNEHDMCLSTGYRLRPPNVNSFRQQPFATSPVDHSLVQFTAIPSVPSLHSSELKKMGLDVLEKVRLPSSKAESGSNVVERNDRPPIKIVLKPVKKREMDPSLRAKCEVQYSSPSNSSDGVTRASLRSVPNLHYPSTVEKAVLKIRSSIPQRRSDTGCPPMVKATSAEVNTHLDRGNDRDGSASVKNCMPSTENFSHLLTRRPEGIQEMCATKTGIERNLPAVPTENNGFRIGDIVWARNGMFPYWPGRIHEFVKENKKDGASIVWYGDNTYTPFIEFSRIEKFAESYDTRFNPMRPDLKYHKAVANAIISCLPHRGYFEKKLSSQVHEVLMKEKIDLGEVNIIAKCKKRTSSASSSRRRKIVAAKMEIQETERTEIVKTVIPAAGANGDDSVEIDPPSSSTAVLTVTYNSDALITLGTANKTSIVPRTHSFDPKKFVSGSDTPPLVIAYDSDEL
uniref:PWWP domain-containing protein n=1 Tax=Onchocerca volvulus TaxID=6282 RepID=A0A8R1XTW9_ONCVO